jgi:UDP-GlcNAc:undecaprenyl-phosphate GlcNAc-1-phosphate transferase
VAAGLIVLRRVLGAAVAAVVARRTYQALRTGPTADRWARSNHRGEPVTLAEGPAVAAGALSGALLAARGARAATIVGVGAASALGALDDLTGDTNVKGLKGHLGALRDGQVTTGSLKLFGLAVTGLAAGALARRGRGGPVDAVLAGGVVAGAANLANLFDLRAGRTAKVFLLASSGPLVSPGLRGASFGDVVAAPCGSVGALLGEDLGEQAMLGDSGANALGAAWGVGAATTMNRRALCATLAAIGGLTLVSERVSFSQVIERVPVLQYLDRLGRRP